MPRKIRQPGPEVQYLRERLRAYLRAEGISVNAFSIKYNLTQSTVQRLLAGRTKTVSPAAKKILDYAKIDQHVGIASTHSRALDNPRLRAAIEGAWDGRPETIEILAELIEAISVAIKKRA